MQAKLETCRFPHLLASLVQHVSRGVGPGSWCLAPKVLESAGFFSESRGTFAMGCESFSALPKDYVRVLQGTLSGSQRWSFNAKNRLKEPPLPHWILFFHAPPT